jgi:transcriptional regulator with XRE-family HTH domain
MTIKEIAELCGVDEDTVSRWSKNVKFPQNAETLQKLDGIEKLKQGKATDLPLETAVAIIRAGGRETLAALLAENAANKNALVVSSPSSKPNIDLFPELPASKLRELRMRIRELHTFLEEGRISVREFRRLALGLDTPDVPDNPIKGALVFKTYDNFMEYAETHKKANPTIYSFAKTALNITEKPGDYVIIRDLYRLYLEYMNTWKAETRNKFVRRIKELYPALEYKQKKVNAKPELAFFGCTLAEQAGVL